MKKHGLLATLAIFICGMTWADAPTPLASKGEVADWWYVFKLNSSPPFRNQPSEQNPCPFGGEPQVGTPRSPLGQHYLWASSASPTLQQGKGLVGTSDQDPVGATYSKIYNGNYHYVVWNDQFENEEPQLLPGCSVDGTCDGPWGHSKGILAWDDTGAGVVMQVSTPAWPQTGSSAHTLEHGNTLGCWSGLHNNVVVSQGFFALRLDAKGVANVLRALQTANVATQPRNATLVNNGGPSSIVNLVNGLGVLRPGNQPFSSQLTSDVLLLAKPSDCI